MSKISAFVGHSFIEDDKEVVGKFLQHFDRLKGLGTGFTWDHAEAAEPKILSQKVREKMMGKNLFIGICTKRERFVVSTNLKRSLIGKDTFNVKTEDLLWKTSDWILQEIGFAIAKDMNIILLLEEGLQKPGGLQGDLEYIQFNRQTPSSSFDKILEMLGSMTPKTESALAEIPSTGEPPHQDSEKEKVAKPTHADEEPDDSWGRTEYRHALVLAIIRNNVEREKTIFEGYMKTEAGKDENESISWRAEQLFWQHDFNGKNVLTDLRRLQKEHPTNSAVVRTLARIYHAYQDYDKAASHFILASEYTTNDDQKLRDFCDAATSAAKHGDETLVRRMIDQAKEIKNTVDHEVAVMEALAQISETRKDTESYLAFKEGALSIRADDHEERSSLAYKYFDTNEYDLALYHYRIFLNAKRQDSWAWNNLGVAASRLSFQAAAVQAYRHAEKLGNTLAMSNLANKLIAEGFLEEADQLCEKATRIENYDHRIGNAIARITKVREEEENKEKSLLSATGIRRSFCIEYAQGCLDKLAGTLPKKWKGEDCELTVTISGNVLEAGGTFKQPKLLGSLLGLSYLPQDDGELVNVRWTGVLLGRGARFNSSRNSDKGKGIMIISQDLRKIKLYETKDDGKGKFYEWECVEGSN